MDNSFQVAIKMSKIQQIMDKQSLEHEAKIMIKLHHKNVIKFHGYCTDDSFWIITEFMFYGSLCDYLMEHPIDINTKSDFALQVSNY